MNIYFLIYIFFLNFNFMNCQIFNSSNIYYSSFENVYKSIFYLENLSNLAILPTTCTNTLSYIQTPCVLKQIYPNYYYLDMSVAMVDGSNTWKIDFLNISINLYSPINVYEPQSINSIVFPTNNTLIGKISYPSTVIGFSTRYSYVSSPFVTIDGSYSNIRPLYDDGKTVYYLLSFLKSNQKNLIQIFSNTKQKYTFSLPLIFSYPQNTSIIYAQSNINNSLQYNSYSVYITDRNEFVKSYSGGPFKYYFNDFGTTQIRAFPYGFTTGNSSQFYISSSVFMYKNYDNYIFQIDENTISKNSYTADVTGISFVSGVSTLTHILNDIYSLSIPYTTTDNIVLDISVNIGNEIKRINPSSYIDRSLKSGTLNFNIKCWEDPGYSIAINITTSSLLIKTLYSTIPILSVSSLVNLKNDIESIHFENDKVNVTNFSTYNRMYLKFKNSSVFNQNQPIKMITKPFFENIDNFGNCNSSLICEFLFFIPSNILPGNFSFIISLSKSNYIENIFLNNNQQLSIISNNFDLMGPILDNIKPFPLGTDGNVYGNSSVFGWEFGIIDSINGFKNGYFIVVSELDFRTYNISIGSNDLISGNTYNGSYKISITTNTCITQKYYITEVVLYDSQGVNSTFIKNPFYSYPITTTNPFLNYLNKEGIAYLSLVCATKQTPAALLYPTLDSFQFYDSSLNKISILTTNPVGETFYFTALLKLNSGISDKKPTLFITDMYNNVYESNDPIVNLQNSTHIEFKHFVQLPFGFSPDMATFSYVGIIGQFGQFNGYSNSYLLSSFSVFSFFRSSLPIINSYLLETSQLTNNGGILYIFGRINSTSVSSVTLKYSGQTVNYIPNAITNNYIVISVNSGNFTLISLFVNHINGQISNILNITVVQLYTISSNIIDNSSSSFEIIDTPSPNSPQTCLGSPICGGPNQGVCLPTGCKCINNYIGLDCSSSVLPSSPNYNDSSPSTGLSPNTTDINEIFSSLISIYSIREIDVKGNVVKSFIFKNDWNKTTDEKNSNLYHYYTKINQTDGDINVDIQYFNNEANITFAGQIYDMYSSSLKYTITISNHTFLSSLNTLELILHASVDSLTNDSICSSKQFGNTTSDDSNFIKLQVNNKSLYGRLIRRGIIDYNKIISIENKLLDSEFNPIGSSHKTQTYVSITIPHFLYNTIIDPDFSILVDSKTDDQNQICDSTSKSLTTSQIVGISIGAVGFVFLVSIVIVIIKKRKSLKVDLQIKLKKIIND